MSLPYLLIHKYSLQPARQLHLHCVKVGAICRILVLHIAPSTEETDRQRTISWNHLCARLTPKLSSSWHIYVFLAFEKKRRQFTTQAQRCYYRPQGKVMFSEACGVILFTDGGGGIRQTPTIEADPPLQPDPLPLEADLPVLTSSGGHCSGRYVFYWTAFLYYK